MTDDRIDMARALELAALGLNTTDPNPRVGCVLVRDGRVVGEGWHVRAGEPHAEVHALRVAGGQAQGATAYVTLEPCSHTGRTPPCADALIAAGVTRVVCASVDPNPKVAGGGIRRLESAGIAVTVGVLGTDARALNIGFFSRFERGRPFVRLKMAMSLDARTAPAAGGKAWISDEASRADVQVWRARSSAILTGAGTVRVDDPRLDVRLAYGPWVRQPVRIVLDPDLTCAPNSKMFNEGNALIFAAVDAPDRHDAAVRIDRVRRRATHSNSTDDRAARAAAAENRKPVHRRTRMRGMIFARDRVARQDAPGRGAERDAFDRRRRDLDASEVRADRLRRREEPFGGETSFAARVAR